LIRKGLKYILLLTCIAFASLLALCRFIPSVNPYSESIFGFLGYATPALASINFCFILCWLFAKKFQFMLIPILAFAMSWKVLSVAIGGNFFQHQDFKKDSTRFSIMTYNVRLLDLYKWSGKQETRSLMLEFFKQKNPTILCLQEFYTGNDSVGLNNIKAIKDGCHYEYYADCNVNINKRGKWGNIVFSHAPILKNTNHDVDVVGNNMLQETTLLLHHDTINLFNIHLKSNKFSKDESSLLSKKQIPSFDEKTIEDSKSIYKKLEYSTINRGLEADLVSNIIENSSHPSIVCGDLNDVPSSYVYFKMRNKMQDAFLDKSYGLGATYNGTFPVLRIDYIFYSNTFHLYGYENIEKDFSDHFPLMANFRVL
jgi:endonuclease/exonuclease/phosphatase family metal-dependent hydrolase